MAQGRGNAIPPLVLLLSLLQSCCWLWQQASATSYTVGNSAGWNLGVDYTQWVVGKTFKVGDVLFFPYTKGEHDVVVTEKTGYDSCTAGASAITYSAGNPPNEVLQSEYPEFYFNITNSNHMIGADWALNKLLGLRPSAKHLMMYQQGCFLPVARLCVWPRTWLRTTRQPIIDFTL